MYGPTGRIATADGFDLHLSQGLDALETADLVIVPGHVGFADPPPDAVLSALSEAHDRGASVASLCVGAFVLGFAGLLDGRRATTHWATADQLAALFPACTVDPDVLWIDEGDILTSAGLAAGSTYACTWSGAITGRRRRPSLRAGTSSRRIARVVKLNSSPAPSLHRLKDSAQRSSGPLSTSKRRSTSPLWQRTRTSARARSPAASRPRLA